jgi:hypothetical protein
LTDSADHSKLSLPFIWRQVAAACQWFLSVVFAGAAVTKLGGYDRFLRTLTPIPWLSLRAARITARAIPLLELVLVVLLLAVSRIGAGVALATLAVFSAVVARELAAGREFRCGCFGAASAGPAGKPILARNAVLALPALLLLALPHTLPLGAVLVGLGLGFAFLVAEVGYETLTLGRAA